MTIWTVFGGFLAGLVLAAGFGYLYSKLEK